MSKPIACVIVVNLAMFCAGPAMAETPQPKLRPVLLQMIRNDAIHDELQLSAQQKQQLTALLIEIDPAWFRTRTLMPAKLAASESELTEQLRRTLRDFLDRSQLDRLTELERQALGTRMLVRDDVTRILGVSPASHNRLLQAFADSDEAAVQVQQRHDKDQITYEKSQRELTAIAARERKAVAGYLTAQQRNEIANLTGERFDFSQITRRYPMAPELTSDGVTWVQGGPLTLEQLRGKVVAVHFYAFQCINCNRNLPHYKAWHDEYADDGLVVIGIQTPETSSERSLQQVVAAAKREGIEYPVVLDSESNNWKSWGNTAWPTVYLIDKDGFLQRWWIGELNWQGATGEQQLRATIKELLAT